MAWKFNPLTGQLTPTLAGARRIANIAVTALTGGTGCLDGYSITALTTGALATVRIGSGATVEIRTFSLEAGDFSENTDPEVGRIIVNVNSDPDAYSWIAA